MKKLLLPIGMAVLGLVLGGGAAVLLAGEGSSDDAGDAHGADAEAHEEAHGAEAAHAAPAAASDHGGGHGEDEGGNQFVTLENQFVVPLLVDGRTYGLVSLAISLEVGPGRKESVYDREPKLRDAVLGVLFDHANTGGFEGDFTAETRMTALRGALLERAQAVMGPEVIDILIQDIARQEV